MATSYVTVSWNPFKKKYDKALLLILAGYLGTFIGISLWFHPNLTAEILLLRALGTASFLLLHFILIIGPLARLDPRWLPVLYNRRHLGVTCFFLALGHAVPVTITYHAGAGMNVIESIFTTDAGWRWGAFPFQALGFVALVILLLMAVTSHDFWLSQLTAPVWKRLHMLVYAAYALLVGHVALGALQTESQSAYLWLVMGGAGLVCGLHVWAGWRQRGLDQEENHVAAEDGFVPVCRVEDLVENEASGVMLAGERVAVLRYEGNKVSAVSGVCQHQNGPLTEGRYAFGCLTCPWHGYQYRPADGCSPPPFHETLPTFRIRLAEGQVWLHPTPNAAGTPVTPALIL